MPTPLQRIFRVLWLFWLIWCVIIGVSIARPYFDLYYVEFPRQGLDTTASVTVPASVVTAYKSGLMSAKDKRDFERDLRSGLIIPPNGVNVIIPSVELSIENDLITLLASVGIPCFGLIVLQYLFFGIISPRRLFLSSGSELR
jgi:hypothetical protein